MKLSVNVVAKPGWILERMACELEPLGVTVNYGQVERAADPAGINYYMPARDVLKFPAPGPVIGLYTHGETAFDIVDRFALCVTMNQAMAARLREAGAERVVTIRPGVEFPPRRLVFGVCGRVYAKRRKGEHLVREAVAAGFDFRACTDFRQRGTEPPCRVTHSIGSRSEFYRSIDYLVVTSLDEGGPMPVIEAIAHGVPVVAPDVGWCWEFPVIRYERGSWRSLRSVLRGLSRVPTWEDWREGHRGLLRSLVETMA
jgi:glycosyltransferase involved in cell wall biosynthesis